MNVKKLMSRSVYILREVKANFKNPCVLWSMGKDSTVVLDLCRKAFGGEIPFDVVNIDTNNLFPEMVKFREYVQKAWRFKLIEWHKGYLPVWREFSRYDCCNSMKTDSLKSCLRYYGYDAVVVGIRRDEHCIRNIERVFSPRDKAGKWNLLRKKDVVDGDSEFESLQKVELGFNFQYVFDGADHVRVHPILHFDEVDVWRYIKEFDVPVNPLYRSVDGFRYRSLGCMDCTKSVRSDARTVDEIICELLESKVSERSGRSQDKDSDDVMRNLRSLGYM